MAQMPTGGEYVVFGSSIGWLAFYGACSFASNTVGVEIMEYLVSVADNTRSTLGVENVRFECADMLQYDVTNARVVMLTSQCWDDDLIAQVHQKLASELQPGSLVVDYRGTLGEVHGGEFQLVETVVTPVSWNPQQQFCIFEHI